MTENHRGSKLYDDKGPVLRGFYGSWKGDPMAISWHRKIMRRDRVHVRGEQVRTRMYTIEIADASPIGKLYNQPVQG